MADPKFTEQLGYLIARANRLIEEDLVAPACRPTASRSSSTGY